MTEESTSEFRVVYKQDGIEQPLHYECPEAMALEMFEAFKSCDDVEWARVEERTTSPWEPILAAAYAR